MKNKFKLLATCLLAVCLIVSVTACSKGNRTSESVVNSESLSESLGSSESISESESESSSNNGSGEVTEKYTVVFVDYDDSVISTAEYEVGATVVVPETPVRNADETYTYEFAGWDKEVDTTVIGNATYKATYTEKYVEYTVKFVNDDGSEISTGTYHYKETVVVPTETPTKEESKVYTFEFAGWDKEIVNVVGDAIYTAKYVATVKAGYKVNEGSAGANESIVLKSSNIGEGASIETGTINGGTIEQSYLAIDGNYVLNDFVVFDFTGKNMPEVAFFAKNYNNSMYAEGTEKQGIVVVTGITQWDGSTSWVNGNSTQINYGFPYMIQDTNDSGFVDGAFANSALGRANLVDNTHYRVIMGFTGSGSAITLHWYLYNLDTNTEVEKSSMTTWGFFSGSESKVGNMTINDLSGSIVLYGKFGTTLTIDKLLGVYENTDINTLVEGLNSNKTYTVTFKDANGNELQKVEDVAFGATVPYDGVIPTPEKAEDALFTYSYVWDKEIGPVYGDVIYTLKLASTVKSGYSANNVTTQGEAIVLDVGNITNGASIETGTINGGTIDQSYLALDGNYALNNYVVFDFTGKNMPEIAFFANNYNNSMYADGTSKQGIVVVTGITAWDGAISWVNGNSTQINYGFPYMIQNTGDGGFVSGAFANSALGRANLVDGTHYRVIMGFTGSGSAITLNWCLYNLDTKEVVEQSSMTTWNFFSGDNAQVGNMTINDLSGSIVLYGKFGTTTTIDTLHGVKSGSFSDIVAEYTA